jgi:hypothetical protein
MLGSTYANPKLSEEYGERAEWKQMAGGIGFSGNVSGD